MSSLITRGEAAHRLKIIAAQINNAVSSAREGEWEQSSRSAEESATLLNAILPHLAEAAEAFPTPPVGSLKYNPPMPNDEHQRQREFFKSGGMGYRGSSHSKPDPNGIYRDMTAGKPPEPIAFTPPSTKFAAKPAAKPAPPKPIVTPPPISKQLPETRTFDLSRITGQYEWFKRQQATPDADVTDWEMTDAFERLSQEQKEIVTRKYKKTGQPVTLSD